MSHTSQAEVIHNRLAKLKFKNRAKIAPKSVPRLRLTHVNVGLAPGHIGKKQLAKMEARA